MSVMTDLVINIMVGAGSRGKQKFHYLTFIGWQTSEQQKLWPFNFSITYHLCFTLCIDWTRLNEWMSIHILLSVCCLICSPSVIYYILFLWQHTAKLLLGLFCDTIQQNIIHSCLFSHVRWKEGLSPSTDKPLKQKLKGGGKKATTNLRGLIWDTRTTFLSNALLRVKQFSSRPEFLWRIFVGALISGQILGWVRFRQVVS